MADAGDSKSPALYGCEGSTPSSGIPSIRTNIDLFALLRETGRLTVDCRLSYFSFQSLTLERVGSLVLLGVKTPWFVVNATLPDSSAET
jgi:hypothetical protein